MSGSALLAGQIVTVTVPRLTMVDGLLALGDDWIVQSVTSDGHQPRARGRITLRSE